MVVKARGQSLSGRHAGRRAAGSWEKALSPVFLWLPALPWSTGAVVLLKHFVLERGIFNVCFVLWKFHTCICAMCFGHSHILILLQLLPFIPPRSSQLPPSFVSSFSSSPTFCLLVSPLPSSFPSLLLSPLCLSVSLASPHRALMLCSHNLECGAFRGALTTWIHSVKETESPSSQELSAVSGFSLGVGNYWIPLCTKRGEFSTYSE